MKGCFEKKANFFRETENLAGNLVTWEIFRETQSNGVKIL